MSTASSASLRKHALQRSALHFKNLSRSKTMARIQPDAAALAVAYKLLPITEPFEIAMQIPRYKSLIEMRARKHMRERDSRLDVKKLQANDND
jgi:hypothetical protein